METATEVKTSCRAEQTLSTTELVPAVETRVSGLDGSDAVQHQLGQKSVEVREVLVQHAFRAAGWCGVLAFRLELSTGPSSCALLGALRPWARVSSGVASRLDMGAPPLGPVLKAR